MGFKLFAKCFQCFRRETGFDDTPHFVAFIALAAWQLTNQSNFFRLVDVAFDSFVRANLVVASGKKRRDKLDNLILSQNQPALVVDFFIELKQLLPQHHSDNRDALGQFVASEQTGNSCAVLLVALLEVGKTIFLVNNKTEADTCPRRAESG